MQGCIGLDRCDVKLTFPREHSYRHGGTIASGIPFLPVELHAATQPWLGFTVASPL